MGFETVTELPGNRAHRDQMDAMLTRYSWAAEYCDGKDVIEVACGAGVGLGILSETAKSVIGGDLDPVVLDYGSQHYRDRSEIKVMELNACEMKVETDSVDVAICFEAIYYFPSIAEFISEVKRILRPGGVLLCSSVNCTWQGFNPSPFSNRYYSPQEFRELLAENGFKPEVWVGFEDRPTNVLSRTIGAIRRVAVALGLVPKTMKGKEFLKKLFYGELKAMPHEITKEDASICYLKPLAPGDSAIDFRYYYVGAKML